MRFAANEGGTDETDLADAWSDLFGKADQLVLHVRYEYSLACLKIGLISKADLLVPIVGITRRLVDWSLDLGIDAQMSANLKRLGEAIDEWAGLLRDRATASEDPQKWANWAETGRQYLLIIAEHQAIAWASMGVVPVYNSAVDAVQRVADILKIPIKIIAGIADNAGLIVGGLLAAGLLVYLVKR